MMNKRGEDSTNYSNWIIFGVFVFILVASISIIVTDSTFDGVPNKTFKDNIKEEGVSFGTAMAKPFVVLDYIIGKIPKSIYNWIDVDNSNSGNFSAALIAIGIWFIFFVAFGDIMTLFGFFSKGVGWVVAFVLTVIVANLQFLKVVIIIGLSATAIFGTVSVLLAIIWIFVMFVLFMFGSSAIRNWIMKRRIQDYGIKAMAGSKKAADAIKGLGEIGDSMKEAGENFK